MTEVENFQKILSENQSQISTENTLQAQAGVTNNVIISTITDFSDFLVLDLIDVLQKKIDEIAERRRIALLREISRKTKTDEEAEFCSLAKFDGILTLSIRPESNAELNREKLYRMMDPK